MELLETGDFGNIIDSKTDDELAVIERGLNQMSSRLQAHIETCLLTEEEKIKMCDIVTQAGADFIKTSTGFSTSGATFDDVKLFAKHVGENVQIKRLPAQDSAQRLSCLDV